MTEFEETEVVTARKKYPPLNVRALQGVAHIFKKDITEEQIKKFWNYVGTILITAFFFSMIPLMLLDLEYQKNTELNVQLHNKKTLAEIQGLGKFVLQTDKGAEVYIVGLQSEYPASVSQLKDEIATLKNELVELNKRMITTKSIAESALNGVRTLAKEKNK